MLDEGARQMRASELDARVSTSRLEDVERTTNEGADLDVGTTDCGPNEGAGFQKPNPPAC